MADPVLRKLEQALAWGATDAQACLFADISPSTLYAYCQEHPEFSERKEQLKGMIRMRAQMVIDEEMQHDDEHYSHKRVDLAKWVLEHGSPQTSGSGFRLTARSVPQQVNINLGGQQTTSQEPQAIRADDLADDELYAMARGEKTLEEVLGGRVLVTGIKAD